jgi:uncharacterized membrane protein
MKSKRIESVDLLRGIIMVIMALDHTRDFFHIEAFTVDPLDPETTSPILYSTRWITHFCAPVFVFLAGTSAWFQSKRKSLKELSGFLMSRGLWIIVVEWVVMTFIITANYRYEVFILQVLWAIGISMVILGLMVRLPFKVILIVGLIIVLGHNLLDYAEAGKTSLPFWWSILHRQAFIPISESRGFMIIYPFLPWTGLMLLGYCFGSLFTKYEMKSRTRILLGSGIGLISLFFLLRAVNLYGDPQPWTYRSNWVKTVMSFMNVTKYPPSLLYICATIGPAMIFLALAENVRGKLAGFFVVIGRVPMFYYIVHFFVLSLSGFAVYFLKGHTWEEGMSREGPFKFIVPGEGFNLLTVYLIWISLVIFILFPLCRSYEKYKREHPEKKWLSYL